MESLREILARGRRVSPAHLAVGLIGVLLLAGGGGLSRYHSNLRDALTPSSPSPAASGATAASSPSPLAVVSDAGAKNIVQVTNNRDGALRADGRLQLTQIGAPSASPVNIADAVSTCASHCQTLAVALQINLLPEAISLAPANVAAATNGGCTGCDTVALAYQYNIRAQDTGAAMGRAHQLAAAMQIELAQIRSSATSLAQAEAGVAAVIAQFQDLAIWLITQRDEKMVPDASPAPATPSASPSPASPAPSSSPQPSPSPSPSGSPLPTPSPT